MYFQFFCDGQLVAEGKAPHHMSKEYYKSVMHDLYFLCRVNKKTVRAIMYRGFIKRYVFIAIYYPYKDRIGLFIRRDYDINAKRVRLIKKASKPIIY